MKKHILCLLLLLLILTPAAYAQSTPVRPIVPIVPTPTSTPVPDDARLAVCTAPTLDGFEPYIIREGERLADLLRDMPGVSVTQIAALNCLDNPEAPPPGAVIWLPARPPLAGPDVAEDEAAEIIELTASAETIQNLSSVDFQWQATGSHAYFYACPHETEENCPRPLNAPPRPLETMLAGVGAFIYPGAVRYRLEVHGGGEIVTQDITIEVTCSQQPLLPDEDGRYPCPQDPAQAVFAAWQPFQGGVMMWFSDRREIWVMVNEGNQVLILPDTYIEGDPELDEEAPEGLFVPIRGFGQAWDRLGRAEGIMGWGMTEGIGFDSARQAAGPRSFTTYIQGPGDTVYAITHIPQLDIAYWTQVAG